MDLTDILIAKALFPGQDGGGSDDGGAMHSYQVGCLKGICDKISFPAFSVDGLGKFYRIADCPVPTSTVISAAFVTYSFSDFHTLTSFRTSDGTLGIMTNDNGSFAGVGCLSADGLPLILAMTDEYAEDMREIGELAPDCGGLWVHESLIPGVSLFAFLTFMSDS